MKLSTRTRYGTRLMLELGMHYGQRPLFLREIAEAEDISEKYLSQIILPLRSAGLVNSYRGAHGGYELSRSPADITIDEIVKVLEGDVVIVDCTADPASCSRVAQCVTRDLWRNVQDAIIKTLNAVTLEELVKRCREKQGKAVFYNI